MTKSLVGSLLNHDQLTLTENGALTNPTSGNRCLDLFFIAGACRELAEDKIQELIHFAYQENPVITLRLIFWAGDIRGGAGERRFFRLALSYLESAHPDVLIKVLELVPHFNRWDSLFHLINNKTVALNVFSTVEKVLHNHPTPLLEEQLLSTKGLLAKHMPRKKQFNNFANKYRKYANIDSKEYRKEIVALSDTVEQKLCAKQYDAINYSQVPSVAMSKYTSTFYKHGGEQWTAFTDKVKSGEAKVNASAIFPHDIYKALLNSHGDSHATTVDILNAQWKSLPNYLEGKEDIRILPVCDTSGSMQGLPIQISIALGIYVSERNESAFKNAFIIFSETPKLQFLTGSTLSEKVKQFQEHNAHNTDLQLVFKQILALAKKDNLTQADLPTHIMIISDMEFDEAAPMHTNFEYIDVQFKEAGFERPNIIFWNVNGRDKNIPIKVNASGACLISGSSPSIIKSVLAMDLNPLNVMVNTLGAERYDIVQEAYLTDK